MSVLTIAHLTFLEARQRKLFWIILVIGLLALGLFALGFYFTYHDIPSTAPNAQLIANNLSSLLLLMGLYGVSSLAVMLAVLVSVDTISGEIASGTIQTIVTKPLRRWEIVLGKWLGLAVMLAVFILAMGTGFVLVVYAISGHVPPHLVEGFGLMVLEGLVFLTLSILGGTRLPPLGNGVVVFMLYGVAFVGGWIEQVGAVLKNETAVDIGIITSLLVPGESMWRLASYLMQPPILRDLSINPFAAISPPSTAMVGYAAAYIAVALGAAMYLFGRRDL
jgi:ABC-type transport system involved in multi-copper enzyme maturation permease subunit